MSPLCAQPRVSGVAGFYPELPLAIYRSFRERRFDRAARLQALLDELVVQLGALPTPWAARIGLEVRGFPTGPLALPLSARRSEQIGQFRDCVDGESGLRRVGSLRRSGAGLLESTHA